MVTHLPSMSFCRLNYNHLSYHICFSPLVSCFKAYVNSKVFYSAWTICRLFIFRIWCCTSSAELYRVRTQASPSTSCTYCYILLYSTHTCFGHISWPSLGSHKFGRHVQLIWQLVIDNWQTVYVIYKVIRIHQWL